MKKLLLTLCVCILGMHIALSQPVIKICNSKDSLRILRQVSQYLEYLDIREEIYLQVKFSVYMTDDLDGITYVIKAPDIDTSQMVNVFMVRIDARLNEKKQMLVLAHEMIHVKQYVKRELEVLDEDNVFWKRRKYYGGNLNSPKAPWEHEAYRFDGQLTKIIEENPSAPLQPLASGNRP